MARVYTFTRTSTMEPENLEELASSLTPPTREEVTAQLEEYFSENDKELVTGEDIKNLTNAICEKFDYLKDRPYGGFAKYMPEKPKLTIKSYSNGGTMFDRESYPRDYSPIKESIIVCSKVDFSLTVVLNLKWISLAYVSKECDF